MESQVQAALLSRYTSCCCCRLAAVQLCSASLSAPASLSLLCTRIGGLRLVHARQQRHQQPLQRHRCQQQQQQPVQQSSQQQQQQQHCPQQQQVQEVPRRELPRQQRHVQQKRRLQRASLSWWSGCGSSSLYGLSLALHSEWNKGRQQQVHAESICVWKPELLQQHQWRSFFWSVPASVVAALLPAAPAVLNVHVDPSNTSSNSNSSSNDEGKRSGTLDSSSLGSSTKAYRSNSSSRGSHSVSRPRLETANDISIGGNANSHWNSGRSSSDSTHSSNTASLPVTSFFGNHVGGETATGEQLLRHTENRIVGVAAEKYFAVVQDVSKYQEFIPWIKESRVLRPEECSGGAAFLQQQQQQQLEEGSDGEVEVFAAELVIGFSFLCDRYTSVVCVKRPSPRSVTSRPADPLAICSSPVSVATSPAAATGAGAGDSSAFSENMSVLLASPSSASPRRQQQHLLYQRQPRQEQQQYWQLQLQHEQGQNGLRDGSEVYAAAAPFEISVCAADSKVFKTLETRWSFWPRRCSAAHAALSQPQQTCYVAFSIAFEFRSVLHQSFAAAFLRDVAAAVGRCFDTRVFQLAAAPHPSLLSSSSAYSPLPSPSSRCLISSDCPMSLSSSSLFSRPLAAFPQPREEAAAPVRAKTAVTATVAETAGGGASIAKNTVAASVPDGTCTSAGGTTWLEEKVHTPPAGGEASLRGISGAEEQVIRNRDRPVVADGCLPLKTARAEGTTAEAASASQTDAAAAPQCLSERGEELSANAAAPQAFAADGAAAEAAQESARALGRRPEMPDTEAVPLDARALGGAREGHADDRPVPHDSEAAAAYLEGNYSEPRLACASSPQLLCERLLQQEQTTEHGPQGGPAHISQGAEKQGRSESQLAVDEHRHPKRQQCLRIQEQKHRRGEGEQQRGQLLQPERQGFEEEKTQQLELQGQEQTRTQSYCSAKRHAPDGKQEKEELLQQRYKTHAVTQEERPVDSNDGPTTPENLYPDAAEDRTVFVAASGRQSGAAAPTHPLLLSRKIVLCAEDPPPLDVAKLLLRLSQLQQKRGHGLRHSCMQLEQPTSNPEQQELMQNTRLDTLHQQQHSHQVQCHVQQEIQRRQELEQPLQPQSCGPVQQQQQERGRRTPLRERQQQCRGVQQQHYRRDKGGETWQQWLSSGAAEESEATTSAAPHGVCRSNGLDIKNLQVQGGQPQHEDSDGETKQEIDVLQDCGDVPRLSAPEAHQLRCLLLSGDRRKIASLVAVFVAYDPQQRCHWAEGKYWSARTSRSTGAGSSSSSTCSRSGIFTNPSSFCSSICSSDGSRSSSSRCACPSDSRIIGEASAIKEESISENTTEKEITNSRTDHEVPVATTRSGRFAFVANTNGTTVGKPSSGISSSTCSNTTNKDTETGCTDSSSKRPSCTTRTLGNCDAETTACGEFISWRGGAAREVTALADPTQDYSDRAESSSAKDTEEHMLLLMLRELLLCSSSCCCK